MSLVKIPAPVALNNGNGMVRTTPPPLPSAMAASNTSPDVAALLAQLQAAQTALAAEKARADAAEKAKAAGRGYSMKASEKGAISIYGVSTRFPITLYAPHLVGIVRDLVMTGKAAAFLQEHANQLSVKVDGSGQAGTEASVTEVRRLADELKRITGK